VIGSIISARCAHTLAVFATLDSLLIIQLAVKSFLLDALIVEVGSFAPAASVLPCGS
jgi:hypothetical protein